MNKRLPSITIPTIACLLAAIIAQYYVLPNNKTGFGPNIGLGLLISASWLLFICGSLLAIIQTVSLYRRRK